MRIPGSAVAVFNGSTGYGKIANVHNFTDASVVKRGDRWWMFGAGLVKSSGFAINLLSASLDPHVPLGAQGWKITTKADDPAQAAEVIPASPGGRWDVGRHCPCYAAGWDPTANNGKGERRERLYYSGSATIFGGPYSNGFAEWDGERWVPQETPCFPANEPWEYGNVSEPNVIFHEDKWHMWYSAGPDSSKRYAQGYSVSVDGKTNWKRSLFYPAAEQIFDHAVIAANGRLEAIFARYSPISREAGPNDGLWWYYAERSYSGRENWSKPEQVLSATEVGANWCAKGIWKPTFQYSSAARNQLFIFFDGSAGNTGARPVFSVGCIELEQAV